MTGSARRGATWAVQALRLLPVRSSTTTLTDIAGADAQVRNPVLAVVHEHGKASPGGSEWIATWPSGGCWPA